MIDGTAPPELVFGSWDLCHNHARLRLLGFTLKGSSTSTFLFCARSWRAVSFWLTRKRSVRPQWKKSVELFLWPDCSPDRDKRLLSNLASCIPSKHLGKSLAGERQLKILVVIPGDVYDGFVNACPVTSGQYNTLKNGVVINDPQYGKAIEILCEPVYARVLLGLAKAIYPDAVPYIEQSIRLAREP